MFFWTFSNPLYPDTVRVETLSDLRAVLAKYPRVTDAVLHFVVRSPGKAMGKEMRVTREAIMDEGLMEQWYKDRLTVKTEVQNGM